MKKAALATKRVLAPLPVIKRDEAHKTIAMTDVKLMVAVGARPNSLKGLITRGRQPIEKRAILDVPSFVAHEGDRICVIGKNGNGKTTFMKVLAGIFHPDGTVWTSAKPTAVLAAGIGMEDELSVNENINVSLILRNVAPKRIRELKEEILDFCELRHDKHKQFKHLSTGYRSRLAFATAICEHPEILLLDEVLGGGDEFFMKKASAKLHETIAKAKTALIATHGPDEFEGVCNRIIVIEAGKIAYDGDFEGGVDYYRTKNA